MDDSQEQPRRFTAQVAGLYHYGRTAEPHLLDDCTEACRAFGAPYVAEPGEIRIVELVTVPADAW